MELEIKFLNEVHSFEVVNVNFIFGHCDDVLQVHFDTDDLLKEFDCHNCLLSGSVPDH